MKLRAAHIRNFRAAESVDIEFGDLNYLIGPNNAGKSAILQALNLVLGEAYPTVRSFTTEDFFNHDDSRDIEIAVIFDGVLPYSDALDQEHGVGGLMARLTHYKRRTAQAHAGDPRFDFYALNDSGDPLEVTIRGPRGRTYQAPLRVSGEMREAATVVFLPADRTIATQLRPTRFTMYGRILQALDSAFTEQTGRAAEFGARIEDALSVLRVPELERFESILRESIRTQTNLADLSLRLRAFDPLHHYRMLALALTEVPGGVEFSPEQMGSGVQAAITAALLEAYRQLVRESAIVAIEEPELHLHPQACRYFRRLLGELAQSGTQVMYSTHSGYFVDFTEPEHICIVRKKPGEGSSIVSGRGLGLSPQERGTLKLNSRFTPEHSEVMFANRVLVVEGAAERMAMPVALQLTGFDLDRESASVLDAQGKESIPAFAKVLNRFKIPFLCIIDEDPTKPGENKRNQAVIDASTPNPVRMLSPDFEGVCGVSQKFTPESALTHFQAFTDQTQIPQEIQSALDEFTKL